MYGCRVIQKALESIPLEQQKLIIAELEGKNINHYLYVIVECFIVKFLLYVHF